MPRESAAVDEVGRSVSLSKTVGMMIPAMARARRLACIGGALLVAAGLVGAGNAADAGIVQVIELFTSQGCSKCPAADRLAAELARAPDTVVMSLPVTLWDYTGWKDTLASTTLTRRQRAYAWARGDNLVYTPQAVSSLS